MSNDVKFEGKERRIAGIIACMNEYGIKDLEDARQICIDKGVDPDAGKGFGLCQTGPEVVETADKLFGQRSRFDRYDFVVDFAPGLNAIFPA